MSNRAHPWLLCALLTACSSPQSAGPAEGATPMDGQALYDKYCKLCHGEQGKGYAADNANQLTNRSFLATASDAFLYQAIDSGRPGTPMSAFGTKWGGPLDGPAIRTLIAYLRSLEPVAPVELPAGAVPGDAELGRRVYDERCAQCHGPDGGGKTALSLNNPVFLATASDGFIRYAIDHGRAGTPMPAFGAELSAAEIDGLTALIRSWARTVPSAPVAERPPPLDRVVIHPEGPAARLTQREGRYVPADEVRRALEQGARMVLLDARPTSDWLKAHIPGALPVPYYDEQGLDKIIAALPRDGTWIIAYCGCPHAASGRVIDLLREAGFPAERTGVIDEGIFVWAQRGYPLTSGSTD